MEKVCFKCNLSKPLSEFYKHPQMADGHLGKCKECAKLDVRCNRSENLQHYQEFDRKRAALPHRIAARTEYAQTPRGREVANRSNSKYSKANPEPRLRWQARNPRKRAAHILLGNAIRAGKVFRMPCVICGSEKSHGHHEDYDKPLDVVWLCPLHHSARHKEMKKEGIIP